MHMDEDGYNNEKTFKHVDVLLMGSSQVEAVNIPTRNNMASLLNALMPYNTYSIGISNHDLCRCVNNFNNAKLFYSPQFIVIETGSVKPSINNMREVIDNIHQPCGTPDSALKSFIQIIPAAKPILNQLIEWSSQKYDGGEIGTIQSETSLPNEYVETLHSFLSIVTDTAKESEVTPIVFYHPSEYLSPDGTVTYKTNQLYLDCFASTCSDLGIVFVDMTDSFKNLYADEHQLAHGFINTGVGSGHLNKYGHRVIAEKLAEVIQGLEAK